MKQNIQVFNNPKGGYIRTSVSASGEPLFCLADLCKAIDINNPRMVRNRLDEDDVHLVDTIDNLGKKQQLTFVTESGMYDVILRSDSPQAKPFRKWVTSEVLPSLYRTGKYQIGPENKTATNGFERLLSIIEQQNRQIESLLQELYCSSVQNHTQIDEFIQPDVQKCTPVPEEHIYDKYNGNIIQDLRHESKLTQKQLAELANINWSRVGRLENNAHVPNVADFYKIIQAMDYIIVLTKNNNKGE